MIENYIIHMYSMVNMDTYVYKNVLQFAYCKLTSSVQTLQIPIVFPCTYHKKSAQLPTFNTQETSELCHGQIIYITVQFARTYISTFKIVKNLGKKKRKTQTLQLNTEKISRYLDCTNRSKISQPC